MPKSISATTPTPSILQVPGAKDVAVEFTSMSKTYSMAGWRIGFAVGNPTLIAALARVKSYLDYGAFTPVQAAAVAALNGPQDIVAANRELYKTRRDLPGRKLRPCRLGHPAARREHVRLGADPRAFRESGLGGILQAPAHRGRVAVAPGVGFGEEGEGYVRIALVENEQRIRQAARNVKRFLARSHNGPATD